MDPLDDLRYHDGDHLTETDFSRMSAGQMSGQEEEEVFYHLDQCPGCARKFRKWIEGREAAKNPASPDIPGPSA